MRVEMTEKSDRTHMDVQFLMRPVGQELARRLHLLGEVVQVQLVLGQAAQHLQGRGSQCCCYSHAIL